MLQRGADAQTLYAVTLCLTELRTRAQVYNVTLGGLAGNDEIFNVSIWFGNGRTRRLGWFPYSLYSFASSRLPTPRGGLLPPPDGGNFTLATGWIGR